MTFTSFDRAEKQATGGFAVLQLVGVPFGLAAVAFAVTESSLAALGAMGLSGSGLYLWWRRRGEGDQFTLAVADGVLHIRSRAIDRRITLADLLDVELETKTIQRVEEGGSMIPAVRLLDARVGVEVDTARVVLRTEGATVVLGDKYIAHMDATEGLGKIRVFLRRHGWLPERERGEDEA
jgi:hypothetical protein